MGILERKEREKEMRTESIIDAAERVFFSKGFETATMMDIAKNAELSKGALYLYFHSKNELCMAILHRSLIKLKNILITLSEDNSISGIDKFGKIAQLFIDFSEQHPDHYKSLLSYREHRENCPASGDILKKTFEKNEKINEIILNLILEGQNDGTISPTINSQLLSQAIWGNFSGIMPSSLLIEKATTNYNPKEILIYHFQLLYNAIKMKGE